VPRSALPSPVFAGSVASRVSGATLLNLDLNRCRIRTARFNGALFSGDAKFDGARVRTDPDERQRVWPARYVVTLPATDEEGRLPDTEGVWGYLTVEQT